MVLEKEGVDDLKDVETILSSFKVVSKR